MPNEAAAGLLKHYLEQRQVAGQTHVGLRPGVMEKLGGPGKPSAPSMRAPAPRRSSEAASPQAAAMFRETLSAPPPTAQPAARAAAPAAAPLPSATPSLIEVPGGSKAEKLSALAQMAEQSPEARALGTLRETMVFAVGSAEAEIMFVGEAPGAEEERQGEPFVGPAGQKLTGIIKAMGLDRSEVYISNICKFRPAMENQGWSNRPPTPVEMRTCLPYIFTEIAIIQPKVLVALGKTAAEGLGLSGPVSKLRGQFYQVQGLPTMVTFHPSYILREEKLADGGRQAKRQVWEDMLQVMEKVGLPISEKQRNFFKK